MIDNQLISDLLKKPHLIEAVGEKKTTVLYMLYYKNLPLHQKARLLHKYRQAECYCIFVSENEDIICPFSDSEKHKHTHIYAGSLLTESIAREYLSVSKQLSQLISSFLSDL